MAGIKSSPVDIAKTPKQSHVRALIPITLLPKKYTIGERRSGRKVATNKKYDDSAIF
jgi:hypothetical protein